ncbi:3-methyl-2-oxobutanoate hydroxymethyltransferase [Andreprevotia lacus DSM 23236]|jgi:3-methyl-2-oxobutanoate hydroxymethyltransferase|uniref:3-methyl-2-oxobutanoate hydroxymethyltransferase n=1 Tax=Andreprevotia lacus DSM 23236 TaxID=1121001 RepID=A0A1W1XX78_9NEIS|nr:3-methyl-2-oxobutanoate hydroxymethyltransferase [Andreprevotia lacus]SMC28543.1 3-methyl-2-oxobutanoate hydroxymethyltransferase [Andreprevotia lacus DSM 23236]
MKTTLSTLQKMKQDGQKIAMLTCYDASFASLMSEAGVDVLLIGDSLGNVIQGKGSTLAVTMEQMIYHTECVARCAGDALVLADLPFASFQLSPQQAFENAARLMAAGAEMVKLEGGMVMAETVDFLVQRGIPVCEHIGFQPQSVNAYGGYKVQGKSDTEAEVLKRDALALQAAGAALILMEMVPARVAKAVTDSLAVPTIGIGAGPDCDGQVLVMHDMLGVYPGKKARFVKNFMQGASSIQAAVEAYVKAVKGGTFPADEHCF